MDEVTRQRELDDVDAGLAPHEVLQRTAHLARAQRDHALAGLGGLAADEQLLELVGLDLTELRRGIDLSGGWSLPCPRNRQTGWSLRCGSRPRRRPAATWPGSKNRRHSGSRAGSRR